MLAGPKSPEGWSRAIKAELYWNRWPVPRELLDRLEIHISVPVAPEFPSDDVSILLAQESDRPNLGILDLKPRDHILPHASGSRVCIAHPVPLVRVRMVRHAGFIADIVRMRKHEE